MTAQMSQTVNHNTLNVMLNRQIANWSVLYIKLHHFHWYVRGQQFFTLHLKFEELYNEAALHIDELAERLLALEGQPVATMKGCLETSSVKEAGENLSAEQMVEAVIQDFAQMSKELKEAMSEAEQENDETTADMLLTIHSGLEKHNWMLKSFLGK